MHRVILFIFCLTTLSVYAYNPSACHCRLYAVEASIATGGNFGIGLARYTQHSELGFSISGLANNAKHDTKVVVPVLFAGLRKMLCDATFFAFGLDFASVLGKDNGENIKKDIQAAIYISLERMLSERLMLVGWIDPYSYEYEKTNKHSTSTHRIFQAGGVAFSYFID